MTSILNLNKCIAFALAVNMALGSFVAFNFNHVYAQAKTKEELQGDLKKLEDEVAYHKDLISKTQKQGATLSRDITILDSKIKKSEAEIKIRQKTIKALSYKIDEGELNVGKLNKKIDNSKYFVF